MSVVIVPAPRTPSEMPAVPTDHLGGQFDWCMFFRGFDSIAYAHSVTELMDAFLPGYASLFPAAQLRSRMDAAVQQAVWIQAQVWSENTAPLTSEQQETLGAPRIGPQAPTGPWSGPVPLVVCTAAYAPYTDVAYPTSVGVDDSGQEWVWGIDPTTEWTFLMSLHEAGAIRLMRRDDVK